MSGQAQTRPNGFHWGSEEAGRVGDRMTGVQVQGYRRTLVGWQSLIGDPQGGEVVGCVDGPRHGVGRD